MLPLPDDDDVVGLWDGGRPRTMKEMDEMVRPSDIRQTVQPFDRRRRRRRVTLSQRGRRGAPAQRRIVDEKTLYKYCQFKHEVCTNYEFN